MPVRDSSLTLPRVVTTFRVCLPQAPALQQVLEDMLAEGTLESPSVLVLAFPSSLFLVEGSSVELAAGDRFLSPGRLCFPHSVHDELSRFALSPDLGYFGFFSQAGSTAHEKYTHQKSAKNINIWYGI